MKSTKVQTLGELRIIRDTAHVASLTRASYSSSMRAEG